MADTILRVTAVAGEVGTHRSVPRGVRAVLSAAFDAVLGFFTDAQWGRHLADALEPGALEFRALARNDKGYTREMGEL